VNQLISVEGEGRNLIQFNEHWKFMKETVISATKSVVEKPRTPWLQVPLYLWTLNSVCCLLCCC